MTDDLPDGVNILPAGVQMMPGVGALNKQLNTAGLAATIMIVDRTAGLDLGRRMPDGVTTREQRATWEAGVRESVATAAEILGTGTLVGNQPNLAAVGYASRPQDITFSQLVQPLMGAGYLPADNPHRPCLALLAGSHNCIGNGIITPFADAPAVKLMYVDVSEPDDPHIITVDGQALWHRLPARQGDELDVMRANLLGRMFRELELAANNYDYDPGKVWACVSPGANNLFYVNRDSKYGKLISSEDWEDFTTTHLAPADSVPEGVGTPAGNGMKRVSQLRLREWVTRSLIELHRVPEEQVLVLPHCTVTDTRYASARGRMRSGNAMLSMVHRVRK